MAHSVQLVNELVISCISFVMMTHVERQSDGAAVGIVTLQEDLLVQFEL